MWYISLYIVQNMYFEYFLSICEYFLGFLNILEYQVYVSLWLEFWVDTSYMMERPRRHWGKSTLLFLFSLFSFFLFFCLISLIIILSFLFSHFILINSHSFICIFSFCYSHVRFQNTWNEYISLVWEKCTVFYWIFSFLKGLKANSRSYVYIMECGLINSMQWMDVLINCFSE